MQLAILNRLTDELECIIERDTHEECEKFFFENFNGDEFYPFYTGAID